MADNGADRREHPWWGVLAFVLCGLLTGVVGVVLVSLSLGGGAPISYWALSPAPVLLVATGIAGSVLAGWFLATVLLSRAPGRVRCPRCGTANDRDARACGACGL